LVGDEPASSICTRRPFSKPNGPGSERPKRLNDLRRLSIPGRWVQEGHTRCNLFAVVATKRSHGSILWLRRNTTGTQTDWLEECEPHGTHSTRIYSAVATSVAVGITSEQSPPGAGVAPSLSASGNPKARGTPRRGPSRRYNDVSWQSGRYNDVSWQIGLHTINPYRPRSLLFLGMGGNPHPPCNLLTHPARHTGRPAHDVPGGCHKRGPVPRPSSATGTGRTGNAIKMMRRWSVPFPS